MTDFYTKWYRAEAEQAAAKFTEMFPEVSVHVMDIHDEKTKEYQYSFFSLLYKQWPMGFISSNEELENKINFCQYVAGAIADNQQSEEYEQGHSFTDQNSLTVHQGGVYGTDEHGDLYEIEPLTHIRPSEY